MTRLRWDDPKDRSYTAGVDRGVIYPPNNLPAASWNGLVAVKANPSGGESSATYYDGQRYYNAAASQDSFSGTIEAFMYPPALDDLSTFGFAYRVMTGPDSYEIHLVYNVSVTQSSSAGATLTTDVELETFSWGFSTSPIKISDFRASSHLVVDTRIAYSWAVQELETLLYGSDFTVPALPGIDDVITLFENASILKITDNGDGTWTADGPESVIQMLDATTFEISWPSAVYVDAMTYDITSL